MVELDSCADSAGQELVDALVGNPDQSSDVAQWQAFGSEDSGRLVT